MNNHSAFDVVIVEDEPYLAGLHRDFIEQNFRLSVVGIAATLEQARSLLELHQPRLVLLDNYLPDGQGVELMDSPLLKSFDCSVIFITAASDMQTCSHAMRSGAFDYIIKPVSFHRLRSSLERFMQLVETLRHVKVVDQTALDRLFNLPTINTPSAPSTKGIEPSTLERVQRIFTAKPDMTWAVEQVVEEVGISKTTCRRYLEYCVEMGFIEVEMQYGNIGHPRRLYRKA
ncbi:MULTISPECIES: response regulator [Buttiauxella]|jgi:two-component system response regulator CitB|uniref:Transcriptional regulatory protein n=1 Tax=Buttiauxella ferragutiae ATCC 51602 TaxID=1354252 RepID=A0ABX2W362_9ENTR|nr:MULTISPECIES: response regulator [Buttiauxella]MCE0826113.1 response regulator [Buttiauxella ferragutiae]OAT25024.1 CitB/DpiA family transcriptional regulator [Buttiauxella ferragutiae ATCC 51602]TDN52253.1 two-component system response regulator CitB [Buttiauxella sp. JUb87]